ncbi:hypothetical protein PLIIFM63780_009350 [Purpureocillium lilacinum]|uniref:Short chain dehydrogenase n=1 Tax=Purpureocillium lilacinum TaxID=33203 RepID=A0A179GIH4_PURLI|nr:short chain dehydrogenase [Purpureocillium lilacinum]PWI69829.1 hypothetical protein PCL_00741 [Purpureocillium lilacinum]GJN75444.1 hypothetical protein PLICBS_009543 [Purpureocillium lilacinum]GJN85776.1 hypothetical protein PLIIFM63780_009350 [Purpureocillium lilacinum]
MTLFPGVALVTGAGSGIGRQVAISFAAEGCRRLAILDRDAPALEETKARAEAEAPGEVEIIPLTVDVLKDEDVTAAFDQVIDKFGRIDYAVNCAGIYRTDKVSHELEPAGFDEIMGINARGLWLCSRQALKHMISQEPQPTHDGRPGNRGSVVNIGSNLGIVSKEGSPAYNASKTAIVSLTKSDAIDYAPHNIRVNCVCPGIIDTPLTAGIPDDSPGVLMAPMKRKGTPQEVADAVLFLSSPKASFILGAALLVDGGYVIH